MTERVVTAVRDRGTRGVEVELDGASWRTVPLDCAVEARLAIGVRVDRERARDLNRALRRRKALVAAARALRYADHSRASLDARLAERGFADPIRAAALGHLQDAGLIDDGRVACARAVAIREKALGADEATVGRQPAFDDDLSRQCRLQVPDHLLQQRQRIQRRGFERFRPTETEDALHQIAAALG